MSATRSLATIYELHGFQPFWDSARLAKLLERRARERGGRITPADYHLATLERLASRGDRAPLDTAQLDLLATDAYTELLYHLYFGKVDPVSIDTRWNFERREVNERDALQFVLDAMTSAASRAQSTRSARITGCIGGWWRRLRPIGDIEAAGGWPIIADGPTLRRGVTDSRVAAYACGCRRAAMIRAGTRGTLFDEPLEAALKRFQTRHFLTPDGAVGGQRGAN